MRDPTPARWADGRARYFGAALDDRSLISGDDARIAPSRFEDWLDRSSSGHAKPKEAQLDRGSA